MASATKESRSAVILLVLSIAVLAAGTLVWRHTIEPKPEPSVPDLEVLQSLAADRQLRDLSAYLSERARSAARRLTPAGLAWDAAAVIEPSTAVAGSLPFSVRRGNPASNLPAAVPVLPRPGDWLLAVARDQGGEPVFALGLFEGIAKERCGSFEYDAVHLAAPLASGMIGGGVFLLDGGLAAFIASCDGRTIAISSSTLADVLARRPSSADLLEERYGFRLAQDPPGLVMSVWEGSGAAAAGLRPGDVVDAGADPPAVAQRRGRTVTLVWPHEPPAPPPIPRGLSLHGDTVVSVAPGSSANAAGILPGDLITQIDGVSVADPARAIERARGDIVATIERNRRKQKMLLRP
jgi:hypothetical protein